MGKFRDLTGERFGRLVVIERSADRKNNRVHWKCECDCGKITIVTSGHLNSGHTKSCGCLCNEKISNVNKTHGYSGTRLYRIWTAMKTRCNNKNAINYDIYGGKGVCVCEEWANSFESFKDWSLENGYSDDLTIDRIDNNGNYCPDNCRWANEETQKNNMSSNIVLSYNNEKHTVAQWSRITGIQYATIRDRIKVYKWEVAEALGYKPHKRSKHQDRSKRDDCPSTMS